MTLSQDLKDLLQDLSRISTKAAKIMDDNYGWMEYAFCSNLGSELQKEHEILELVHKHLSVIPNLKEICDKYLDEVKDLQTKLENKDNEISRLKQKHLNVLEERKKKSQEKENKRILNEFYKHAQSREISSLLKKMEREKQLMREEMIQKEKELNNVKTEHKEEVEKLKIQLVAAKSKNDQLKPSNFGSEFYRKKIVSKSKSDSQEEDEEFLSRLQLERGSRKAAEKLHQRFDAQVCN